MFRDNVLILGGTGLLGYSWAVSRRKEDNIFLVGRVRRPSISGVNFIYVNDLCPDTINDLLRSVKPLLVVNAIANTDIDNCERDRESAFQTNVVLARRISHCCNSAGIKLVHISTDQLFDGSGSMLDEASQPNPVNYYGITKALAEEMVGESNPSAMIVRTNFYGWGPPHRKSFSDFILSAIENRQMISLFDDLTYTPINVISLVEAVMALVNIDYRGIINVVGDEAVSKYEFGFRLSRHFGLPSDFFCKTSLSLDSRYATRPRDMTLCNQKMKSLIDYEPGGIERGLSILFNNAEEFRGAIIDSLRTAKY